MTSTTTWDALAKRLDNVPKPVCAFKLCDSTDVRERYLKAQRVFERSDADVKALAKDAAPDLREAVQAQAKTAQTELTAAQKDYDAHTVVLRFTALDRKDLTALMAKHPPTEQEEAKGEEFHFDTFSPALIAAASLDGMPEQAAAQYLDTWTPPDARALWNAAWSVQHVQRTDLGKG
ncbi:hypothetical protein AB0G67_40595 [Streptomyces sp. NPDC021056]|uniref:hypothetical protein n=1 Tax=Streptomyces sp. NPDC021056 TaxID=3155012 RepID=UPI0033CBE17D